MESKLFLWEPGCFLFTLVFGTLSHFLYQWSGSREWVGVFTAANESTWEHLKLLYFPMMLCTLCEYAAVGKQVPNFVFAKAVGLFCGLLAIVTVYYTYSGIIGRNFLAADILTFFIGVVTAHGLSFNMLLHGFCMAPTCAHSGKVIMTVMAAAFLTFTKCPPKIALFRDPITGRFGI